MTDSTTTMIVLGMARTKVLIVYSPKLPGVHALVMLSSENDENSPNGFEWTSARVLSALDTARTIGNRVRSDSTIRRTSLPPRARRRSVREFESLLMRRSCRATAGAGGG